MKNLFCECHGSCLRAQLSVGINAAEVCMPATLQAPARSQRLTASAQPQRLARTQTAAAAILNEDLLRVNADAFPTPQPGPNISPPVHVSHHAHASLSALSSPEPAEARGAAFTRTGAAFRSIVQKGIPAGVKQS